MEEIEDIRGKRDRVGCIIPGKNWKGIKRNVKVWTDTGTLVLVRSVSLG